MMNRIIVTFLVLLALATVAAGQLWMQSKILISGPITALNAVGVGFSLILLLVTLAGLSRMLYRTGVAVHVISRKDDHEQTR